VTGVKATDGALVAGARRTSLRRSGIEVRAGLRKKRRVEWVGSNGRGGNSGLLVGAREGGIAWEREIVGKVKDGSNPGAEERLTNN
jgi:hypothetical protein